MDELKKSSRIAADGMHAQGVRLRVISENLANANSLPTTPGANPYQRKVVTFKNALDAEIGADSVRVGKIGKDNSEFLKRFDPKHPAADRDGYVLAPNINPLIELTDMREAQRSYEANLQVVNTAKAMLSRAVEMLR